MSEEYGKYVFVKKTSEEMRSGNIGGRFFYLKFSVVVAVLAGFLYLAWYSYHTQISNVNEADLPIVYASENIKVKPGDPGGFVVAHRDKEIYDHISGKTLAQRTPVKTSIASESPVPKREVGHLIAKQMHEEGVTSAPVDLYYVNPTTKQKTLLKETTYTIRIAKIKSVDVMDKAWDIMYANHQDSLKGLKPEIKTENKNGGEHVYLHAASVNSLDQATKICNTFKAKGKKCSVHPVR